MKERNETRGENVATNSYVKYLGGNWKDIKKTDTILHPFYKYINQTLYFGISKILGSISLFTSTLFTLDDNEKAPKSIVLA